MAEDVLIIRSHTSPTSVEELVRLFDQHTVKITTEKNAATLDTKRTECRNDTSDCCLVLRYPTTSNDRTAVSQSDAATNDSLVLRDSASLGSSLNADTGCASAFANDCSLVRHDQDTSSAVNDSLMCSINTRNLSILQTIGGLC